MAKPKRIILVRHGESEGNKNKTLYGTIPDYAIDLTELGRKQATEVGKTLNEIIKGESVQLYSSSFYRARRTTEYLQKELSSKLEIREDLRLMEQGWGNLVGREEQDKMSNERDSYSHFYYRGLNAENGVDLYVRLSSFLDTLHRDFEKEYFPENCILVSHGLTIRMFIARWFHYTVEQYEAIKNPKNCQHIILELNPETGKYELTEPLEQHQVYHTWKYVPEITKGF